MKRTVTVLTLAMLVASAAIPLSAAAGSTQQETYAGSHVTFETTSDAVVDYRVNGEQTVDSIRVQSQSETDSEIGLDASADVVTSADIAGSAISVDSKSEASARMTTESGATIAGHDNGHGSLVVTADEQSQYVAVDLNSSAESEQVSDERVVFTTDDGTQATAMVVGEGNVSATEQGNLTAALEQDSRLVVRTYTEARSEADAEQESMIVEGTAAASVYVMEQGGQQVTDTVNYTQDTSVEVTQRSAQRVNMTVSRTASEGRVVIAHFSEAAVESAEDVDVRVDGEAAVQASSYSEVRQATNGGDSSKYVVESSSEASAQSQVVLGINHFSTRSVTMDGSDGATDTETSDDGTDSSSGDDSTDTTTDGSSDDSTDSSDDSDSTDSSDDSDSTESETTEDSTDAADSSDDSDESDDTGTTSGNGPGFGIVASVLALLGAAVLARRQ